MASSMELEKDRPFDALVQVGVPDDQAGVRLGHPPPEAAAVSVRDRSRRWPHAGGAVLLERDRLLALPWRSTTARATSSGRASHVDVGTDRARLDVVSDGFIDAFNASPLAAEGTLEKSDGYAATPLTGVWANYPYLHNGSVPTLYHLLGPASERPRISR